MWQCTCWARRLQYSPWFVTWEVARAGWLGCQDGTNHPALSSFLGDKEKVVPLRGTAVGDRVQVLAWCSLSHVGGVLQAASSVMDSLALCTFLLRSGPHHCPTLPGCLMSWQTGICAPRDPPLSYWMLPFGGWEHWLHMPGVCLCHQAPEALPEIRHTFP